MQVIPALNRQRRREVDARMRRITRKLEACGTCTTSLNGGEHLIDKLTAGAPDPTNKYNGVVAAVGVATSIPQFAAAQSAPKESPVIVRRVTMLAALIGFVVTDQPKAKWKQTLRDLTSFQMADDVMRLASRMKGDEAYAVQVSLTFAFLKGATGDQLGAATDPMVIGYQRAMAAFDRMVESIRRQSMANAVSQKLNGLGVTPPLTPRPAVPMATLVQAAWWSDINEIGKAYAEARRAAGSPGTTGPTARRREMWQKWLQANPKTTRAEFVNIVRNDPNDKTGYFEFGPRGYAVGSRDVVNMPPEGGWTEGLVKVFYYEAHGFYPNAPRTTYWLNTARGQILLAGRWVTNPAKPNPLTIAEFVFDVKNNVNDKRGVFFEGGPNECREAAPRTDAAWIKEDCEFNATAEGDAQARVRKVGNVAVLFQEVTGFAPTPCDINYYSQFNKCSAEEYRTLIRAKEAAGRPPPLPSETNPKTAYDIVTEWVSNNIGKAFDFVIVKLQEMGKAATGLLCSGFEKLFTGSLAPVGGVLCSIVKLTLGGAISAIASAAAILKIVFVGLGEFFANLLAGQLLPEDGYMKDVEAGIKTTKKKGAVMALVEMVNAIVVIALGGTFSSILGVPIVDAELTADQRAQGVKSLETLGRELPPTFTIMLVASVLALVFAPSPQSIAGLVLTLVPAISKIVGPVLKARIPKFRDMPIQQITAGIEAIVKIGAMVIMQAIGLADVFDRFGKALERYYNKITASGPAGQQARQALLTSFTAEFPKAWNRFMESIKTAKLMEAKDGLLQLLGVIPDLLIAIAQHDPDLAEVAQTAQQIVNTAKSAYQQAQEIWAEAMKEFKNPEDAINAIRAEMDKFRQQLDQLCADPKFKALPACQFPREQQTEKIVTVEKIVYRDRAPEPAKTGAVSGETKVTTAVVTTKPQIPPVGTTVRTDAGEIKVISVSPGVVTNKNGEVVAIVPPPAPPAAPPPVVVAEPGTPLTPDIFVQPKKKGGAAPLVLAAGGFAVGGPVGAAIGLVVGLVAAK